jgi:hypothetical protein
MVTPSLFACEMLCNGGGGGGGGGGGSNGGGDRNCGRCSWEFGTLRCRPASATGLRVAGGRQTRRPCLCHSCCRIKQFATGRPEVHPL